jgi:hypothetical protein
MRANVTAQSEERLKFMLADAGITLGAFLEAIGSNVESLEDLADGIDQVLEDARQIAAERRQRPS